MIKNFIFGSVVGLAAFVVLDYATSIPSVMMSYSTNSCVEVWNYSSVLFGTSEYSCANMPLKFNWVWVK